MRDARLFDDAAGTIQLQAIPFCCTWSGERWEETGPDVGSFDRIAFSGADQPAACYVGEAALNRLEEGGGALTWPHRMLFTELANIKLEVPLGTRPPTVRGVPGVIIGYIPPCTRGRLIALEKGAVARGFFLKERP